VRRLALLYLPNVTDTSVQYEVLRQARGDPSFLVRLDWIRVWRQLAAARDCGPLLAATGDTIAHVQLAAIDALGGVCPNGAAVAARLREVIDAGPAAGTPRAAGRASWHARAHALVALARTDTAAARPLLGRDAAHPVWQVRLYVARGAALTGDSALLTRLAGDSVGSVRDAAIDGLSAVTGHGSDDEYMRALASPDYHVVLAGARALRGTPRRAGAVLPLLDALDRVSSERRETSRDPRLEIVARLEEVGDPSYAPRLIPYLRDLDSLVAERVATLLNRLVGGGFVARPAVRPAVDTGLARLATGGPLRLRLTMSPSSGGGAFVLRMDPAAAPATVARILRLAGARYYDGLTWHRVVPNFVLQGGSPGMNEYAGDGPFMRDELGLDSHRRGTIGISTRGRDTGDAQLFINLVDNIRLDHDYTVFARVESGLDVVDRILEGDVIARAEVVR
jgi:cyclophilin family peptidyl-prolyl cis-trans isomerase/HEAT repeat protein